MIRQQFDYDPDFNPPAPVVEVNLRTPHGVLEKFPALLDSGADGTTIPTALINQIGVRRVEKRQLISITGERTTLTFTRSL